MIIELAFQYFPLYAVLTAIAIPFVVTGFKLSQGKWGFLVQIGGYNCDPTYASKHYDVKKLFKMTSAVSYITAFALETLAICSILNLGLVGVILFLVIVITTCIMMFILLHRDYHAN